jgi:hypothetical protein
LVVLPFILITLVLIVLGFVVWIVSAWVGDFLFLTPLLVLVAIVFAVLFFVARRPKARPGAEHES